MRQAHTESGNAANDVIAIEVKAIEWLERATEIGSSRGFVGELVLCIIQEGREGGDSPEDILATIVANLDNFASAAAEFQCTVASCKIPNA